VVQQPIEREIHHAAACATGGGAQFVHRVEEFRVPEAPQER
jgi:hypothetical protein